MRRWHHNSRSIVAAVLCVSGGLSACTTSGSAVPSSVAPHVAAASSTNPFRIGRPLIIPHGGGDGMFPEDTLYAYEHSMAMGGDVVDIDVLLSADDIPIAFHDDTLQRTTNGVGNVEDKTYAQLATLDAGYNFDQNGQHPYRGKGLTIPTVQAILEKFPHSLVTLDLKDLRVAAVQPLCSLLETLHRTRDVFIGVDSAAQVLDFRTQCPEVRTSGTDADRQAMRAARATNDPNYVSPQIVSQPEYLPTNSTRRITAESLAYSHRKGVAVLTWVVDDPATMKALIGMGIDGIYTRRPDVMLAVLQQMGLR